MPKPNLDYKIFLETAVEMTGFTEGELEGTGQAETYFNFFKKQMSDGKNDEKFKEFIRYLSVNKAENILNTSYAELAQNIIWLFYFGQWKRVSSQSFDSKAENIDTIVSAQAFRSGLGWQAIGTNPPGTKFPGFKSWTREPRS